jgi:kynureninase
MLFTTVYTRHVMLAHVHAHQTIQCLRPPQILHGDNRQNNAMSLTFAPLRRHHGSGFKAWFRALETWVYLRPITISLLM